MRYENSISIPERYGRNFNRGDLSKKLDIKQSDEILDYLKKQPDITQEWVDEIDRVDKDKKTCIGVANCPFGDLCIRNRQI